MKTVLSNIKSFKDVVEKRSSVVATLHGSHEPGNEEDDERKQKFNIIVTFLDRWIVLSLSGDGTRLGLELARILEKLRLHHNWIPQRTIVFCFFDGPRDSCGDNLSDYSKSMIVAYLAVHGKAVQSQCSSTSSNSATIDYHKFSSVLQKTGVSLHPDRI